MEGQINQRKSFYYALFLHISIFLFVIISISFPSKVTPPTALPFTQADKIINAVSVNQKDVESEVNKLKAQQAQKEEAEKARLAALKAQAMKAAQQKKEQETQLVKLKSQQEAQLAQLKAQQEALAKQNAQAKQALNDLKKQATQAKATQTAEKKQLKKDAIDDLQNELAAEQTQLNKQKQVQINSEISKYTQLMLQAMGQNWQYPPDVDRSKYCTLEIKLAPGGIVQQVFLKKSSGDTRLDQSAIAAVYKSSPLPVSADPEVFKQMQDINLKAAPQDTI